MEILVAHNKTRKFHGITEITENEKFAQNTCVFLDLLLFDSLEYFERCSGIFLAVAAAL